MKDNWLIIDTSTNIQYFGYKDEKEIAEFHEQIDFSHAETINNNLAKFLININIDINQINNIVCVIGPGSYTGLRVGLVVAKTIAFLNKTNFYIINSFQINNNNKDYVISAQNNQFFVYNQDIELIEIDYFDKKDPILKSCFNIHTKKVLKHNLNDIINNAQKIDNFINIEPKYYKKLGYRKING